MSEQEVLRLWKQGLNKNKLAELYKRSYNQQVKIIRSSVRHRHSGKFITNYEALAYVEMIIYKNIMKEVRKNE